MAKKKCVEKTLSQKTLEVLRKDGMSVEKIAAIIDRPISFVYKVANGNAEFSPDEFGRIIRNASGPLFKKFKSETREFIDLVKSRLEELTSKDTLDSMGRTAGDISDASLRVLGSLLSSAGAFLGGLGNSGKKKG
jgi:hypothetical protein